MKLESADKHLKEKLKDPYFKALYEIERQKIKIAQRIIQYRIAKNLSQKQLAQKVGVTRQHISKIENGEFSNISTLEKVLLFIGFTVKMQAIPISEGMRQKIERIFHSGKRPQLA